MPESADRCPVCGSPTPPADLSRPGPHGCVQCATQRNAGSSPTRVDTVASAPSALTRSGTHGEAAAEPSEAAQDRFGKYGILGEVGRGGMGMVYRAWDTALRRTVALKVLRTNRPARSKASADATIADEDLLRFLREAQTTAQLRHPNIVQVYEVGEVEGHHYIAMEYIGGGSLREQIAPPASPGVGERPARAHAALLLDVARAIHYAHEKGVIHRDLKPENILIKLEELDGRPSRTPMVVDFGLARSTSAQTQLTQTGQVLGTPSYMSPEQCEGRQAVDARSDVFSLGAVLYEALTGRKAFEGDTLISVMYSVMTEEPRAPRTIDPRLHPDLETICLKAIEKDRARRYPTAQALADDLQRYLDGEPIQARPVSRVTRLWRKAAKHKAAVLPSAAAIAIVAALGGASLWSQVARAREIAQELQRADALWRDGRVSEARDGYQKILALDQEHAGARLGFEQADAELARRAQEAEAGRQALLEAEATARLTLRKAGLVQNVLGRWAGLTAALEGIERVLFDSAAAGADRAERMRPHWTRVDEFIQETPEDPTSQATMLALAGWAHWLSGSEQEGRAWMRRARELDPDLPYGALMEAWTDFTHYLIRQPLPPVVLGLAGIEFGRVPAETGEMRELRKNMERMLAQADGAKVWGEGLALDFRRAIEAIRAVQAGRFEDAEAGLSAVIGTAAMQPFRNELLFARGRVRYLVRKFAEGLRDLDAVQAVRPNHAAVHVFRGVMWIGFGGSAEAKGEDPREAYRSACAALEQALALEPDYVDALTEHGIACWRLGDAQNVRGEQGAPAYAAAVESFSAAGRLDPRDTAVRNNRGLVLAAWGEEMVERGVDARETLGRAAADFEEALRLDPELAEAYVNRGSVLGAMADACAARGEDPRPGYRQAVEAFAEAIRRKPASPDARLNRGNAQRKLATAEEERGGDPGPWYEGAVADLDAALERKPGYAPALRGRGLTYSRMAESAGKRGQDPEPWEEKAAADLEESARLQPGSAETMHYLGLLWWGRAYRRAAAHQDATAEYAKALAAFDEAIRVNPADPMAYNNRAGVHVQRGEVEEERGGDPRPAWEKALADWSAALERNPRYWKGRANRGWLLERMGRDEEALADYEAAVDLAPANAKAREMRDALRKKLGR